MGAVNFLPKRSRASVPIPTFVWWSNSGADIPFPNDPAVGRQADLRLEGDAVTKRFCPTGEIFRANAFKRDMVIPIFLKGGFMSGLIRTSLYAGTVSTAGCILPVIFAGLIGGTGLLMYEKLGWPTWIVYGAMAFLFFRSPHVIMGALFIGSVASVFRGQFFYPIVLAAILAIGFIVNFLLGGVLTFLDRPSSFKPEPPWV